VLADFCLDPTENIITSGGLSADLTSMTRFYTSGTCTGEDIIGDKIAAVQANLQALEDSLRDFSDTYWNVCDSNAYYIGFTESIDNTQTGLDISEDLTECERLWQLYTWVVPQATCDEFMGGVVGVLATQLATALAFILTLAFICINFKPSILDLEEVEEVEGGRGNSNGNVEMTSIVLTSIEPSAPPKSTIYGLDVDGYEDTISNGDDGSIPIPIAEAVIVPTQNPHHHNRTF
jgi:hypothetical protein